MSENKSAKNSSPTKTVLVSEAMKNDLNTLKGKEMCSVFQESYHFLKDFIKKIMLCSHIQPWLEANLEALPVLLVFAISLSVWPLYSTCA